ncbi:Outer membrane receptor proteins, mostly Fe transport [Pedobacter westerhofensis]|uniref:Outer membrane receptor proteins, mostly Fe transport n=1 Tax=Pedobacter westerhofensis TaxID=425512 RepID=A0A521AFL0_9SPHI|nr:outer membrane beta-barrel family protein [Pedobacter westerhofensis]SMO33605.1 Outer membrane receptor proteins, mostly Fe transport [Pedobacter westerhofensis]
MKTLFYFLILLLPFQLSAQQKLNGIVNDEKGKPLDAATVTLSQNGQVVNSQLADMGKFTFSNLNQSTYQLSVSLIGYKPLLRSFNLPKDSLKLILLSDSKELKEVAITFKKPTIERKIDRIVFNVENSIMASGGSAWEALTKAPGVQTSNDGVIKTNNKGATVYMDGKPVRLSGDDLSAYLQSIPSDNISKIEVMPNPSSKYEAQGGAVINIVSKKSKADGFNASLSGGYTRGELNRYTGNGTFNYRKNKLNVFGSYGYSDRDIKRHLDTYTIFQSPGSYAYWDGSRASVSKSKVSNYTAGADYNLTDNQVIGVLVTGNNSATSGYSNGRTNIYNNYASSPDSVLRTTANSKGDGSQYSFNLNYKVKLDTNGKSLNIDVDYAPFTKNNTQNLNNLTYLPDGSISSALYQVSYPSTQKINIWSGKVDYEYRLGKTWSMESGAKYSSTVSENLFDFYNTAAGTPVLDLLRSDRFHYTENTAAGYTSISGSINEWTYKGGLRAEYTTTKGISASLDSINTNKYLRVFPTVFVSYKASENNEFGFAYSKRVERPDYRQLNPAKSYSSPYNYQSGNPFLKPSIINDLRLTYTLHQNYTFAAVYTQINDLASNVTVQDNINKTFFDTQQNIGSIKDAGIELSSVHHPASWWEINNIAQGYRRTQSSDQPGNTYNYKQYYCYLRTDHAFTIDKNSGWKAELGAWYTSAVQQGTLKVNRTYDLSTGVSKPLLNKQATLRFSASDILNGNPYRILINNNGQNNGIYQKNDTRTFTVSFSYKLGSSVAAARKRTTASEEERKRAN